MIAWLNWVTLRKDSRGKFVSSFRFLRDLCECQAEFGKITKATVSFVVVFCHIDKKQNNVN